MQFPASLRTRQALLFSILAILISFSVPAAYAATIGTVVPVLGTAQDLIYDPARNLVYIANSSRGEVDIYDVGSRRVTGNVPVGVQPGSLALSPDLNTLYVANQGSNTITAVNLNTRGRGAEYTMGTRPDAIAVGNDGQVVVLGPAGLQRLDPVTGRLSAVAINSPMTPPAGLPTTPPVNTPPTFIATLSTTASGNLIIGVSALAGINANNRIFVYEVASGTVLRSRSVSGLRPLLSVSPDGSRFMAGPFLFDTQTLTILGRAGTTNAGITGGSAFSVDGNAVYATFNTQTPINPLNPNNPQNPAAPGVVVPPGQTPQQTTVLQVMRSSSLTPQLGLRLPEAISTKIIISSDGSNLFANSTSGMMVIPVGNLNNLPILDVSTTNVVLSRDMCNRTIATATVQIRNAGGGRLTFGATVTNQNAQVILNQRSGVAPATLTISYDPRSTTNRGTTQYVVQLASPEAVNIEPAILVNLNFRDVSDRGAIIPMNGVGVDMQMDTARQRLYIANYTQDQVEVFSLANQTFLPPIRVGNRPLSMAMANPSTLVVANWGSENLSVVDLDAMQEVDEIPMAPVPLNGTAFFPRYIAASSNAILFSASPLPASGVLPGNGSIWQLSLLTHSAYPRLDLGVGALNSIQGHNVLTAAGDGSGILIADAGNLNNGAANLRFYDPIADTFPLLRGAAVPGPFRGAVSGAADGSFYVVDNQVFNSVLGAQGSIGPIIPGGTPAQTQAAAAAMGVAVAGNFIVRVQSGGNATTPQALQRFNALTLQQDFSVSLAEQVMDINLASIGQPNVTPSRQWPPRVTALEIGVNNQTQILPHSVVLDGNNNVYLLTLSGLSVVSMAPAAGRVPSFAAGNVLNSASRTRQVSPGSLITILGTNLADSDKAGSGPLPRTLGGVCVTANEMAIPLISTSPTQIDAQLPAQLTGTRVTLTVRSTRLGQSSPGVQVAVTPTAPGVFSLDVGGMKTAAIIHASDFALVTPDYPAERDETLLLYTTGLGPVNPDVQAGELAGVDPFSVTTDHIQVTVGGHPYPVLWSGLAPYMVGIYQINIYVPGDRAEGDSLPVVVTAGGVSSAADDAPLTAVH
jgi:uncharacterized protein (TIGR03437 family)